jgi:hypothetical protein
MEKLTKAQKMQLLRVLEPNFEQKVVSMAGSGASPYGHAHNYLDVLKRMLTSNDGLWKIGKSLLPEIKRVLLGHGIVLAGSSGSGLSLSGSKGGALKLAGQRGGATRKTPTANGVKLTKGSQAAKEHMARLRAMRKK